MATKGHRRPARSRRDRSELGRSRRFCYVRAMLNLPDITVRLGGRTIIDGATAKLPPRGRIGLIGRNGAGKTTLVRVITGQIEPDTGSIDMPRGTTIGYIAQEAPSGSATPFETVLAADTERTALMAEA